MARIHPLLAERKSILAFDERLVDDTTLHQLFEAARWAPSAFNEQPWRFIVARRGEHGFDALDQCLAEGNRLWASHAAFLFLSIAKKTSSYNQQENRHALHDLGLAVGNFTMQATECGIHLHQMAGFNAQMAIDLFAIPADFEPVAIVAGGYPGNAAQLPDQLQTRATKPRTRKSLNEIIFSGKFGEQHPLFPASAIKN